MTDIEINSIKEKANIVDIISEYIPLTQKGKNYFAVCPFHDDHNPSMVVSSEKQIFNCFTCHTGGSVFTFVMRYENVSFPEAVQIVARKVGININVGPIKNEIYEKEYKIMDLTKKYYTNILNTKEGINAKDYLKKRGINADIIKEFQLGLSPTSDDNLYNYLIKQKYDIKDIESLGLINKNGIKIYDTFKNRIMIPIDDINGHTVGFTGRIYENIDQAKYVNTKETKIFKKGEILFNFAKAKNYIRESKYMIIVEGKMDAIKMYSYGIKNVIALMGTALTKYQIDIIKKQRVKVILMLDNDDAGLLATIKNGDLLHDAGIDTEVVRLEKYKDPDEFIEKQGKDEFVKYINKSKKYLDFKIDQIKIDINTSSTTDIANYIKQIIKILQNEDEVTKEVIINKICKETGIDESLIKNELKDTKQPVKKEKIKVNIENTKPNETKYEILVKKVLFYLLNDVKYIKLFQEEIGYFKDKLDRDIFNETNYFYKNNKDKSFNDIVGYLETNDSYREYIDNIISSNISEELDYNTYCGYINNLKRIQNKQEIEELKEKIKKEKDIDKKLELMTKLTKVKKGSVDYGRD